MNSSDLRDAFCQFLDEIYPDYEIYGIKIPASRILLQCDPIAFDEAFWQWVGDWGHDK